MQCSRLKNYAGYCQDSGYQGNAKLGDGIPHIQQGLSHPYLNGVFWSLEEMLGSCEASGSWEIEFRFQASVL